MKNFITRYHGRRGGSSLTGDPRWNLLWAALSGAGIGLLSLLYAFGLYRWDVLGSYFRHPLILALNVLPVVALCLLLYCLYGRVLPAYITTAVIVLGFTIGDYYLLKCRDDPLMFPDILNLKEALAISVKQNYDLSPDARMVFGLLCVVAGGVFLAFFAKGRMDFPERAAWALLPAAALAGLYLLCANRTIYDTKTDNFDAINRWSSTQVYISKGFVYPFLHSVTADRMEKPEGYRAADAQALLGQYEDADIPMGKRASVVTIQLEAFADFSDSGAEGVDWERAYGTWHGITAESYHGRLIDNIFAGGTINTERAFLTGFAELKNFRKPANSYAWYFGDQGYTVLGSHPSYAWFYNRENVNKYLGIPTYYYWENRYLALSGEISPDRDLLPDIFRLWQEAAAEGPVFSFNVTYQGHGPYDTEKNVWDGVAYTDGRYSAETTNIVDNYLASVQDTAECLRDLLDGFAAVEEPVVVVIYGDHRPWLGYGSSAYHELGIDLDISGEAGLYNKYSTDYVIWANDAAKRVTGGAFVGNGPDLSPNFLMNEVFALCGWTGNAYLQATNEIRETLPVVTTIDRFRYDGEYVQEAGLPDEEKDALREFRVMQYYWENEFYK